jgi:peptidoglycan hydrolase CwlO-like protein
MQQTKEFHERVDTTEETLVDLQDKIAVLEYNILRELRTIRKEIRDLYEEEDYEDSE